jgi:uncharacterized membrane protein
MKRAGRVSPIVILGVLGFVGIIAVLILTRTGTTPAQRVNEFFMALGEGDVDTVLKVSTFGDEPDDVMRPKWQKTVERTKYYRFALQIKDTNYSTPEEATVAIDMYQNIMNPGVTSKRIQIPVVKVGGEWKVDARSINRQTFPALPR